MGFSITSDKSRPVYCKSDRQILNTDIMQNLVISPLQERRINRHNRSQAACCQSCSKCDRMLLSDPHVKKSFRITVSETLEPCSVRHCGCDRHKFIILFRHFIHHSCKHIRIICFCMRIFRNTCLYIKRLCAMKSGRMSLRRRVASPFLGNDMNEHGSFDTFGFRNNTSECFDIMSVHRS